jgi:hypothetical protein
MERCPNCLAEIVGEYCAACGERRLRPEDLSASRLAHDVVDQVASFRFKFKTLRTLGALMTPGLLTMEFLAGRRRRYLDPLKLYLVCAALFFLAAPWAGFTLEQMIASDDAGRLPEIVAAQMATRDLDRGHFAERFDLRVKSIYTVAVGAGVLASALLLQLMSRHVRRPFGAHVVFALHVVSFQYLVTAAIGATRRVGVSGEWASGAGLLLIALYLAVALKQVYEGSTASTLMKAAALLALTLAANYATSQVSIRLALRLV